MPCEVVETRCHSSLKVGSRACMRKSMILPEYIGDARPCDKIRERNDNRGWIRKGRLRDAY
jgi:hypothetical protein